MSRSKWRVLLFAGAAIGSLGATWAMASETITYSHDAADNRVNVNVTGAP